MKKTLIPFAIGALALTTAILAAVPKPPKSSPLAGTWKLVSSKTISKGTTKYTFPVANQEMIKVFTNTQFSFFKHDLSKGKGENSVFDAGSGTYTLNGNVYKEHLAYCSAREWENQDFSFTLTIKGDTLIQKGIEKIESLGVNHEIVETYVRTGF
ncbi:hypothetical protein SAMN05660909_04550 [Chitinophaga terrae (ex Kim and Jung 2007)]|uniref:Lipocalin-like domain-containing protein n=1 Tax=Chitinophaga terrae (ex Kim and Jung 2007) TaxID=408074 RepID=A0A1H4FNZ7_9BACT|nr:lipocalin family protein [Chitinophaga terrae (ex Kim and Jung 2007)]MDQ0108796.1 hypothetical protein [Chitinophaga terrae (ex Kim and Jung 2007)]GEP89076.1 hypothetical protein CTE07_07210 [Chitinophaga terrae (ex Kim and Jung 2007)]SEA98550.1 hypothetical protein SAMN05660909_04550 [Chitinophaga terrae (ex Kim and Jung 2007)]